MTEMPIAPPAPWDCTQRRSGIARSAGPMPSIRCCSLGYIPPVNTMPEIGSVPVEQPAYPLEMLRCAGCGHVQIREQR